MDTSEFGGELPRAREESTVANPKRAPYPPAFRARAVELVRTSSLRPTGLRFLSTSTRTALTRMRADALCAGFARSLAT